MTINVNNRVVNVATKKLSKNNFRLAVAICKPTDLYIQDYADLLLRKRLERVDNRFCYSIVIPDDLMQRKAIIYAIGASIARSAIKRGEKIINAIENI